MKVKVDFSLSRQFGVVERIIFRFVINGYGNVNEYSKSLPLFSDSVIANAIKHLVNQQVLAISAETGVLSLSEPIKALIIACHDNEYDINIPDNLVSVIEEEGVILTDEDRNLIASKELILRDMLPNVKLEFLISSLDFRIYKKVEDYPNE